MATPDNPQLTILGRQIGEYVSRQSGNRFNIQSLQGVIADLASDMPDLQAPLRDLVGRQSFLSLLPYARSRSGSIQRDALINEVSSIYRPEILIQIEAVLNGFLDVSGGIATSIPQPAVSAYSEKPSELPHSKRGSDLVSQVPFMHPRNAEAAAKPRKGSSASPMKNMEIIVRGVIIAAVIGFGVEKANIFNSKGVDDRPTVISPTSNDTVTVGILHSLTGTMAISETTLVAAEIMAIDEINAAGGVEVDGKKYKIEYIVEDGASDWPTFAEKSKKLIDQDQVPVVFGGWTSASRKAMLPVFESRNAFLYYPLQYEGQECSNNIFYTGATPNQQSEPATKFMYEKSPAAGKPFFLVGSDYVFPRTSNTITKEQLASLGGEVVGEDYLPLGNTEVAPIIAKIKMALPNGGVIINTLNGDQNVAFFKLIQYAGITPANGYYVMSYSIAEEEISIIGPELFEGHYGAWNYMASIDTPASKKFAADFKAKYGEDRQVADPQESAYNMVYLWKAAVEKANSFDNDKVREALVGIEFDAPQGPVTVMPNHHLSQTVRIGQITADGQFDILESSDGPVAPQAWNQFEPSSKGFACDWTDAGKGGKYKLF